MIAKREVWKYTDSGKVWVGKYKNSQNLPHWHPDCELLFVERGKIEVFCEKKNHRLVEGQAFFIASGQVHSMHATDPDTVLIVIVFTEEIMRGIGHLRLVSPLLTGDYRIPEAYSALRGILTKKAPLCGSEAACKVLELMIAIFRGEAAAEAASEEPRSSETLRRLLEEMNENYRFLRFSDAAAFMGMAPTYFSRYFRETTGVNFSRQLNTIRTDAAIRLLESTDLPMTEIADRCGFGTIRNFNRIFKQFTGYAPRDLPEGYNLNERFPYPSDSASDPTLYDCELIESPT